MFRKIVAHFKYVDVTLSKKLAFCSKDGTFRPLMMLLELSGHGVPWISGSLLVLLTTNDASLKEIYFNLLVALLLDLVCVGILKGLVRRQRPSYNQKDMFATVSLDNYSFPSGHATRVAMVTIFLLTHLFLTFAVQIGLLCWAISVGVSRVLLGRHHVSDVLAGFFIGYLQSQIIEHIWFSLQYYDNIYSMIF